MLIGKRHHKATFEMLTGYMPPEFERFLQFNSQSGEMVPLSEGPGEIRQPIVFSVPVGSHAMGIYGPLQTTLNTIGPTYGRFRFTTERVVKWNCVFRVRDKEGLAPGAYPFRMFVLVGNLMTVRESLRGLHLEFAQVERH